MNTGSPVLHRRGRAQAVLDRHAHVASASCRPSASAYRVSNCAAVVHEQEHFPGGRADDDAAVRDDGAGDGFHRDRLRQRGAERVQAARARGERAIPRLAGAERVLDRLALGQLAIRVGPQRLGRGSPALGELELPRAIERLRAAVGQRRAGTRDRPA